MLAIPPDLARRFDTRLAQRRMAVVHRPHYTKWRRYYLDFCHKYRFEPADRHSISVFNEKLRTKNQSESQRQQADHAIAIYYEIVAADGNAEQRQQAVFSAPTAVEGKAPSPV